MVGQLSIPSKLGHLAFLFIFPCLLKKTRLERGSNPGPLGSASRTLSLHHTGSAIAFQIIGNLYITLLCTPLLAIFFIPSSWLQTSSFDEAIYAFSVDAAIQQQLYNASTGIRLFQILCASLIH